jgi:hypothetical protein
LCPKTQPANSVDVQTMTQQSDGSHVLPPIFGKAVLGNKYNGTIHACAQASWGPPQSLGNAVPLTISACEWLKDTNNGATFATAPTGSYAGTAPYYTSPPSYLATLNTRRNDQDYDSTTGSIATNFYRVNNIQDPHTPTLNAPIAGSETVITTHGFGNTCAQGNPGWAAPGQFGWLSKTTCSTQISGSTYTGATGNTDPPCGPIFQNSRDTNTPIYLPVYTTTTLSGSNTVFTLDGFAAFVVTGWSVGGGVSQWNSASTNVPVSMPSKVQLADASPTSVLSAANKTKDADYCGKSFTGSSSDVCIYGYFTKALIPLSSLPDGGTGGNNLGASSVQLTG